MQRRGNGQCLSGPEMFSTQKKRGKKIKLAFYSVLPPAGKMEKPLKRWQSIREKLAEDSMGQKRNVTGLWNTQCEKVVPIFRGQEWSSVKAVYFHEWCTAPFIQKGQQCPYREVTLIISILEMGDKRLRSRLNVQSVFLQTSKLRISSWGPCQGLSTKQQSSACSHSGHKKKPIFAALCLMHTQAPNAHPQSPLA